MSGGIYEQLRYLCDLSTGLMCRLHHMKQRYQTKDLRRAPGCMVSSNFANIRRKIERGFSKSNPYILIEKVCRAVVWVCSLPLRDDCIYMIVRFFVIVTSAKGICIIDSFLSVRLHIVRLRLYCVYPRLHLTGQHFRGVFQGSWSNRRRYGRRFQDVYWSRKFSRSGKGQTFGGCWGDREIWGSCELRLWFFKMHHQIPCITVCAVPSQLGSDCENSRPSCLIHQAPFLAPCRWKQRIDVGNVRSCLPNQEQIWAHSLSAVCKRT